MFEMMQIYVIGPQVIILHIFLNSELYLQVENFRPRAKDIFIDLINVET